MGCGTMAFAARIPSARLCVCDCYCSPKFLTCSVAHAREEGERLFLMPCQLPLGQDLAACTA